MQEAHKYIKSHEGFKAHPYYCPEGKLTIGFGRNLSERGLTKREAEFLLLNDIEICESELSRYYFYEKLDSVRKDVMIELCYNIGLSKLLKFKKMIDAIERGDFEEAAKELLDSKWRTQVGENRSQNMAMRLRTGEAVSYVE